MELLYKLIDDQYPLTKITHKRMCARAIILNERNEACMLHVYGDDIFGHRDYYETPGGGVKDGEDPRDAVIREALEETGTVCEIIQEIGIVDDYYNLIGRNNLNYYYLLRVKEYAHTSYEEYEKEIIDKILWKPIDEAIALIENTVDLPLAILVKRSELPIYKLVRDKYIT